MPITEVSHSQRLTGNFSKVGIALVTWADGSQSLGTCAVVGQNDILTAGHVVYNPDKGGWASDIEFYFGADYNNISDTFDSYNFSYSLTDNFRWNAYVWSDQLYADLDNKTLSSSESQYDIALIGVSKKIGDAVGWFGIDWGRDFTQSVTQVGYPENSAGMMTSTIIATKNSLFDIYESSQDIMGRGSSGGPLYTSDGYIIGVKSSGDSTGAVWADIGFLSSILIQKLSENDSLLGPISPTYQINANSSSFNEGTIAQFTLVTTNVSAGTVINYTISGISISDIQSGALTGYVTVSASGQTIISVPITADGITESAETLTITAQGKSASIVINDTSNVLNTVQVFNTDLLGKLLTNGAKRYSGTSANDTINGTAGGDLIYGNDGDDKLYGLAGNDLISGLNGNDYLSGGDGDDRLFGSKGDDQIYGGKGSDTALYDSDYANYTVSILYNSKNAVSGYKIVDKSGKEGTDTISTDVEFLDFNFGRTIVTLNNGTVSAKTTTSHSLSIIVDKGILGNDPVLLKGLIESITRTDGVITAHSLIYAGTTFDYNLIDSLIMTVTRDGEFTTEFTKEINDYLKTEENISYKVAVEIVGAANIDGIIVAVAGSDGAYVS